MAKKGVNFSDYLIYIDTCSLIDGEKLFTSDFVDRLRKDGGKLIVLNSVYTELIDKVNDIAIGEKVLLALHWLGELLDEGLAINEGPEKQAFADNVFLATFQMKRVHNNIMFITQDKNVSIDVLQQNKQRSVQSHDGNRIEVYKIDVNTGDLVEFKEKRREGLFVAPYLGLAINVAVTVAILLTFWFAGDSIAYFLNPGRRSGFVLFFLAFLEILYRIPVFGSSIVAMDGVASLATFFFFVYGWVAGTAWLKLLIPSNVWLIGPLLLPFAFWMGIGLSGSIFGFEEHLLEMSALIICVMVFLIDATTRVIAALCEGGRINLSK